MDSRESEDATSTRLEASQQGEVMDYRLVKLPGMPLVGLESRYVLQVKGPTHDSPWTTVPIVLFDQLTEAEQHELVSMLPTGSR